MFGSRIRTAKKYIGNGKTVFSYAINELFDPSSDDKLLRLFWTEEIKEEYTNNWVPVPREGEVDETTLFGGMGDDGIQ